MVVYTYPCRWSHRYRSAFETRWPRTMLHPTLKRWRTRAAYPTTVKNSQDRINSALDFKIWNGLPTARFSLMLPEGLRGKGPDLPSKRNGNRDPGSVGLIVPSIQIGTIVADVVQQKWPESVRFSGHWQFAVHLGNPAVSILLKPVAFRPRLTAGLAFQYEFKFYKY